MAKSSPPKHLSSEAATWWKRLQDEYGISDHAGLLLLQTAMESFDRLKMCQAEIARDGQTVKDRFDQPKPHPLLATERDARGQMLAALKALNLDVEAPSPFPGRPPGVS